jgi:hypothetical protein
MASIPAREKPENSEDLCRWPELAKFAEKWTEDVRQIAVSGYRQVQENGPDVCDSEHSDHGENITLESMDTHELIGEDGKLKAEGPSKLSQNQAFVLKEAARQLISLKVPTTQATKQPLAQSGPTTQGATEQSRPPAPLDSPRLPSPFNSDNDPAELTWDQLQRRKSVQRRLAKKGRAGGLVTVADLGKTGRVWHTVTLLKPKSFSFHPRRVFAAVTSGGS